MCRTAESKLDRPSPGVRRVRYNHAMLALRLYIPIGEAALNPTSTKPGTLQTPLKHSLSAIRLPKCRQFCEKNDLYRELWQRRLASKRDLFEPVCLVRAFYWNLNDASRQQKSETIKRFPCVLVRGVGWTKCWSDKGRAVKVEFC